jgi:hypothetical protein
VVSYPFSFTGPIHVATGNLRIPIAVAGTITTVMVSVGSAPAGTPIVVDVLKNGTSVYNVPTNRPSIPINGHVSSPSTPDVTALAVGDYLTVNLAQVGSAVPGSDLCIVVAVEQ